MDFLKQKLKRHQSGCVRPANKFRGGNLDLEADQQICGKSGSMFVKKDSTKG